jgi:hypothetical protein
MRARDDRSNANVFHVLPIAHGDDRDTDSSCRESTL